MTGQAHETGSRIRFSSLAFIFARFLLPPHPLPSLFSCPDVLTEFCFDEFLRITILLIDRTILCGI